MPDDRRATQPNRALQHWFDLSGYSKQGLATEITRLARAAGHANVCPDGSRVRRWLVDGEIPRDPVPDLLAQIFSERTGSRVTPADLGICRQPADQVSWGAAPTTKALGHITRMDLLRQGAASHQGVEYSVTPDALLQHLQTWAHATPSTLPNAVETAGSIGMNDVEKIQATTDIFKKLDNAYGGGLLRTAVVGQVAWANSLAHHGTYSEPVGRALMAALADLCGVAGWMSHDIGATDEAVRYLVLATQAAKEGGDRNLAAHLLQCLARVYGYIDKPAPALEFITLATYGSRETATPRIRSGLYALEARFNAMLGRERPTLQAINRSLETFAETGPSDHEESFTSHLDETELHSTLGEVYLFLSRTTHRPEHAATGAGLLSHAASSRPAERLRSKIFDYLGLSRACLALKEPEAAIASATTAVDLSGEVSSIRILNRFRDLLLEGQDFKESDGLTELLMRACNKIGSTIDVH
ncbi:transcriptional regulator [Spongiactinospora gelatinilytica]|uniref:Transcriptional regulator n=1 Tax=Spongiactinospora gelatinilytica TaxID=2666298 RepID=A0A2W2HFS0_9ACTN|nr:transcriptional regulator [Spongiactinospora gelatinilytica]PZG45037.1 transcriptional regulator [Spongiactinospora gelatinilytica]